MLLIIIALISIYIMTDAQKLVQNHDTLLVGTSTASPVARREEHILPATAQFV